VTITDSPNPHIAACLEKTARKASFPATVRGGGFTYPLVFGPSPP
jgi:hypothetical protein